MGKPIQVRDVPPDVHAALTAKAQAAGLSLSAYVRALLERDAHKPSIAEVLARTGGRAQGVDMQDVVGLIAAQRDRRR